MFLRFRKLEEQDEAGAGGGGVPDRTDEFNAILDKMEAADAAEESGKTGPAEEPPAPEPPTEPVAEAPAPEPDDTEAPAEPVAEEPPAPDNNTPAESPEWLTDDLVSRGAMYHMTPEQMATQGSEESVEQAMLFIDNYHARQRELAMQSVPAPEQAPPADSQAPPAAEQVLPPDGQMPPGEQPPAEPEPFVFQDFTEQIGKLGDSGYDEDLTGLIQGIHSQGQFLHNQNQMLVNQVQQLTQHASQVRDGAISHHNDRVMAMVDDLDRVDLFGTEAEHNEQQARNSELVNLEVQNLIQNQGKKLSPETVRVAYQRVFAPQLINEAGKARTTAVQKQSKRRMGRGATATPREDIPWDGDPTEDPVLLKMGREMLAANAGLG